MIAAAQAVFDPDVEEAVLRVYGLDPHTVTLRRLWVLVRRLPQGSWKKDQGPASWSEEAYLLAGVIDAINQVTWVTTQVNSKRKVPFPQPVERPGWKQQDKKKSWGEFTDSLIGMEGVIVE